MTTSPLSSLSTAPVIFDPVEHKYYRDTDHRELSGITGMLSRQLFPAKYAGVSSAVLDAAAKRGADIHDECQRVVMFGYDAATVSEDAEAYYHCLLDADIVPLDTEYVVSDGQHFASPIDMVDTRYNLYDIKTTSTLDTEYLRWQLSVYAYLFEIQNPTLTAGRLAGIHVRDGKARITYVERIPVDVISSLLTAEIEGRQFVRPSDIAMGIPSAVFTLADMESAIVSLKEQLRTQEALRDEALSTLHAQMVDRGISRWETKRIILTAVAPTESTTFDSKALKAADPDTWAKYAKKTQKKGYLKITLKKDK